MHADLVGPSRVDSHLQQSELTLGGLVTAKRAVVRNGFPAARTSGSHAGAADTVPADAGRDGAGILFQPSVNQCHVSLFDLTAGELRGQLAMCLIVFCDHD